MKENSNVVALQYDERKGFSTADEILHPEQLLEEFIGEFGLRYHYKTNSVIDRKGNIIDDKLIRSRIRLYCLERGYEVVKSYMDDALRVWRDQQSKNTVKRYRNKLGFKSTDSDLIKKYSVAVSGRDDEIMCSVIRHFIWQVKRKLFELPVEHHMMITLYGKSGAGKSVAIQKLLSVVDDIKLDTDFSIFQDKFSGRVWERNFVIFCDEMGDIQNTSVEKLKNVITAPRIEARAMRSDQMLSVKQNATLISASNNELRDLINDPTSARRYFQIDCLDKIDWDSINEIDYESLWASVDETGPCPILPYIDEIKKVQESSVRAKGNIEQFLEECCEVTEFGKDSPTTKVLYNAFVEFCRMQGIRNFEGLQQFSRRLPKHIGELNMGASSKKTNRGTVWSLSLIQS